MIKLVCELLNILESQKDLMQEKDNLIHKLINENMEKENIINELNNNEEYLY